MEETHETWNTFEILDLSKKMLELQSQELRSLRCPRTNAAAPSRGLEGHNLWTLGQLRSIQLNSHMHTLLFHVLCGFACFK